MGDRSVPFMPSLPLYPLNYIGFRLIRTGVQDSGRGNYSGQVASESSSWAEGVAPCPFSSEQPLRLSCDIDMGIGW